MSLKVEVQRLRNQHQQQHSQQLQQHQLPPLHQQHRESRSWRFHKGRGLPRAARSRAALPGGRVAPRASGCRRGCDCWLRAACSARHSLEVEVAGEAEVGGSDARGEAVGSEQRRALIGDHRELQVGPALWRQRGWRRDGGVSGELQAGPAVERGAGWIVSGRRASEGRVGSKGRSARVGEASVTHG